MPTPNTFPHAIGPGISNSNIPAGGSFSGNLEAGPYLITAEANDPNDGGNSFTISAVDLNGNAVNISSVTYQGVGAWPLAVGPAPYATVTVAVAASGSGYQRISINRTS